MLKKIPYLMDWLFSGVMDEEYFLEQAIEENTLWLMYTEGAEPEVIEGYVNQALAAAKKLERLKLSVKYRIYGTLAGWFC